jgi:hypothetical protein
MTTKTAFKPDDLVECIESHASGPFGEDVAIIGHKYRGSDAAVRRNPKYFLLASEG